MKLQSDVKVHQRVKQYLILKT